MEWIAHRGSHQLFVENSYKAFERALIESYDGCECDIRRTKDKQFIVYHDDTFKRLNGIHKKVKDVEFKEAITFPYMNDPNEYIIGLETLCTLFHRKNKRLFIEIKDLLTLLEINNLKTILKNYEIPYTIISFHLEVLMHFNTFSWMWLVDKITHYTLRKAKKFDVKHIGCNVKHMKEDILKMCIDQGFAISLWTVNHNQTYWSKQPIQYITTDYKQ